MGKYIGYFLTTLCIIGYATGVMAQEELNAEEAETMKGIVAFHEGRHAAAVQRLKNALEQEPDNAKAAYYLAQSYYRIRQEDKAITALKDVLKNLKKTTMKEKSGENIEYSARCRKYLDWLLTKQ